MTETLLRCVSRRSCTLWAMLLGWGNLLSCPLWALGSWLLGTAGPRWNFFGTSSVSWTRVVNWRMPSSTRDQRLPCQLSACRVRHRSYLTGQGQSYHVQGPRALLFSRGSWNLPRKTPSISSATLQTMVALFFPPAPECHQLVRKRQATEKTANGTALAKVNCPFHPPTTVVAPYSVLECFPLAKMAPDITPLYLHTYIHNACLY